MARCCAHRFDGDMVDDPGGTPDRDRAAPFSRAAYDGRDERWRDGERILFADPVSDSRRRIPGAGD